MPSAPLDQIEALHLKCGDAIQNLRSSELESTLGTCFTFLQDLEAWKNVLSNRPAGQLHTTVAQEYALSLLNVCQGQYRNAFKSLRLVLELSLQSIYLSSNLVELDEWMKGRLHTSWTLLTDSERGPLGKRFCRAFFPEMEEHSPNAISIACKVYTELSECIHGNIPMHISLPTEITFEAETLELWIEKADVVRYVVTFGLTTRYLQDSSEDEKVQLQQAVVDNLGHHQFVRNLFEETGCE